MIIKNDGYFYITLKDKDGRDFVLGSYLTQDEALKTLLQFMKQFTDYLNDAISELGNDGEN
jgi:hypothetical protein